MTRGILDKMTGRTIPVTCDFCATWQRGSDAARITFIHTNDESHTYSFLCCADLECSRHVRNKTAAAVLSRTQLHEDMTPQQRIDRLSANIRKILAVETAA
ncbi:MAG TPA: FBP domain-containing protein [Candidatus Saccharimonadales bacterium]|nr:FBP domain-containing protein [Candidatus Saccharimonadales bacterium]